MLTLFFHTYFCFFIDIQTSKFSIQNFLEMKRTFIKGENYCLMKGIINTHICIRAHCQKYIMWFQMLVRSRA